MVYLVIVSLIWAASFGLIKSSLVGLDAYFVSCVRISLSLLVFLPFLRVRGVTVKLAASLMVVGGIQFGVMYVAYIYAYQFLAGYEIAVLTLVTPIFVVLVEDIFEKRIQKTYLLSAFVAVLGGLVIQLDPEQWDGGDIRWKGVALMQVSNLCFAFGQVAYRRMLAERKDLKDHNLFGLLYLGAFLVTGLAFAYGSDPSRLAVNAKQVWVLLYLGVVASGLCFFLWNYGARRTNPGALGVLNNLKIPLGVCMSLMVFETGSVDKDSILRLVVGGIIIVGALTLCSVKAKKAEKGSVNAEV